MSRPNLALNLGERTSEARFARDYLKIARGVTRALANPDCRTMGRSRRISKKRHRASLTDVLYEVSVSHVWRARLYEGGLGSEFVVDAATLGAAPPAVVRALRRYGLRYLAGWVPHEWTRGWAGYEGRLMFRVRAADFPEVAACSANNPATIYGRPRATPAAPGR